MPIIARFTDLIAANFNALLDRIEDPERMLAHLMRELEGQLDEARQQAAQTIAAEHRLKRELDEQRAAAARWHERARRALDHGRDDLARRALARQLDHDDAVRALEPQAAEAARVSAAVKQALAALAQKLTQVQRRHRLLRAGQSAARVRLQVQNLCGADASDFPFATTRLEQAERRLQESETQLLAQLEVAALDSDLDRELDALARDERIDAELQRMKETPPAESPGGQ